MTRTVAALLVLGQVLIPSALVAGEPAKDAPKRRVFVLHAGLHTIMSNPNKNIATEQLQRGLAARGIAERDLVALDNPFPTASWSNLFPLDGLTMYLDSMDPGSRVSHDHYLRMHKALEQHGVKSGDEVVWVGHSAGGQIGLTMAHLANKLGDYPDLAKVAKPYRFDMVILVGTPVGKTQLPAAVKVRTYYSPQDTTVHLATHYGALTLYALGYPVAPRKFPEHPHEASMVRLFHGLQHNHWNSNPGVLDCIAGEFQADYRPRWQTPPPLPNEGLSLAQLLARAVAEDCHISLEDLPRRRRE